VDADQIDEIQFKPASGEASQAEKANGTWQLTEPEKTEADQDNCRMLPAALRCSKSIASWTTTPAT